jgi:tetratricopeptide (TPR) repeat protein
VTAALRGALVALALCALLAACTTAGQLLFALVPDGTVSMLLGKLERESDTNRKRVAELERKADWPGLAKFADENIAKEPNNASWWLVAGVANSKQKHHARAIECYQEIVRLDPTAPEGWNLLAQEYRITGEAQRAVEVLTRALAALRESAITLTLLGESYSDLAQFEPAALAYRQALDIDGGLTQAWSGLARAHIRLGRHAEAESIAQAMEKTNPQLAAAIRNEISAAPSR